MDKHAFFQLVCTRGGFLGANKLFCNKSSSRGSFVFALSSSRFFFLAARARFISASLLVSPVDAAWLVLDVGCWCCSRMCSTIKQQVKH